uniref:Zinc finger C3HC4 RING-type domain-containing protein n=1 Tax=Anopheles minimus TaxID=112268 RepID=A0A182WQ93_9DIPT
MPEQSTSVWWCFNAYGWKMFNLPCGHVICAPCLLWRLDTMSPYCPICVTPPVDEYSSPAIGDDRYAELLDEVVNIMQSMAAEQAAQVQPNP